MSRLGNTSLRSSCPNTKMTGVWYRVLFASLINQKLVVMSPSNRQYCTSHTSDLRMPVPDRLLIAQTS